MTKSFQQVSKLRHESIKKPSCVCQIAPKSMQIPPKIHSKMIPEPPWNEVPKKSQIWCQKGSPNQRDLEAILVKSPIKQYSKKR
jgi:hypothetical protein